MGAACFLAVCPTSCLWWPSPPATVQVKRGKTEKQRPFFFVRLRIDGQELCGPRHVTEEAAKRDKESLNGKPIVEQRAIIQRLRSAGQESPRKRQCLWWPPKESLAKASMAVYVKAVTYKGKPFFFVRMQFGKGSERKELCGPRHVTEEAAKRDKESLDGKPIDEQLAGVASLELLETKLPSREALRQLML